jgi:hypothetical protein
MGQIPTWFTPSKMPACGEIENSKQLFDLAHSQSKADTQIFSVFCQNPLVTLPFVAYVGSTDKGKSVERRRRKTTGLRTIIV